ncbi:uncharacterized protein LOC124843572 [Vigna umbellata]|uniref:uncharacterized protein LOC124843572 n=1 Tax=Vigna umbellata TaxID=87088 RepID=UPI001F5F8F3F|nr:uncharacterized protein LOC124843572 [Vigna umbellata]
MELSACSAEGLTQPKTMKLNGMIGDRGVLVLIDSGASHNFISRRLAEELKLSIEDTPPYQVSLGDGQRRETRGCCEKVEIILAEAAVEERLHLFELGGVDVILGVEWLAKLGEVMINWKEMTMGYNLEGKKVMIQGDPALPRQLVEPQALLKLTDAESWVMVWDRGQVEKEVDGEGPVDLTGEQKAEAVLQAHYRVFQEVQGLPPPRDTKHPYRIKFETWKLGLIERQKIMVRRDLETGGGRTKNNRTEENYTAHESSNLYEADTNWTSWLVPMFVVANIVVFLISMYINNCPKNNLGPQGGCMAKFLGRFSFELMQENPLLGPSYSTLTKMGALRWDNVENGHQGWRLVTCIWLHAGIIHLLANMLSLVFIAIRLEQQFGFVRIGVIYLVTIQDQYPEFNLVDKVVEGEKGNVRT